MSVPNPYPQDGFLETLKPERTRLSIYLVNGIHLTGWIEAFDPHAILLGSSRGTQLIYKRGISTIVPASRTNVATDPVDAVQSTDASINARRDNDDRLLTLRKKS